MGDLFSAMKADDSTDTAAELPPTPPPAADAPPPPPRKLPAGVLDAKPPPQGEKAKAKGKAKGERVSHENRERMAETLGPVIDHGLNVVSAAFGSPIRADVADPEDHRNALVFTVKFAGKSATLDTRRNGVKEAAEKARASFGSLLALDTPGRSVAYHLAGVVPGLANIETWLEDHPWTTLALVSVATVAQFSKRVAETAASAPVVVQNKAPTGDV